MGVSSYMSVFREKERFCTHKRDSLQEKEGEMERDDMKGRERECAGKREI